MRLDLIGFGDLGGWELIFLRYDQRYGTTAKGTSFRHSFLAGLTCFAPKRRVCPPASRGSPRLPRSRLMENSNEVVLCSFTLPTMTPLSLSPSSPCPSSYYPYRSTYSLISLLFFVTIGIDGFSASTPTVIGRVVINKCNGHCHCLDSLSFKKKKKTTEPLFVIQSGMDVARYIDDDRGGSDSANAQEEVSPPTPANEDPPSLFWDKLGAMFTWNGPPIKIDDTNLLLYDAILLTNLSVSISFFVAHRLNYFYVPSSLNEGALLSLCWIISGLANGSFLYSAVDGHYDPRDADYADKGGPKAAGLLAVSTFVTTCSLRIAFALLLAVAEHRPVGSGGEELIPLEIPFGLVLMSAWRTLHAEHTIR